MSAIDQDLDTIQRASVSISKLILGNLSPEEVRNLHVYELPSFLNSLERTLDKVQEKVDIIDMSLIRIQQLIEEEGESA